ncbi:MAG: GNAT family N-acetyltransferase [Gemmatimonadaceae bacterium]
MSDFYRSRRIAIKDTTALLTFFIGFVWSGAFVWPFMENQIDQGDMIRGLAYFLAAVLGCAILTGFLGLEVGNLLGSVWERYHKMHRGYAEVDAAPMLAWTSPFGFQPVERDATRVVARFPSESATAHDVLTVGRGKDVSDVYYAESGVYTASFIPLAQRVRPMQYDARKTREALSRTANIGAWDGGRLVGVVRILSDGYTFSALADILVDPEYQRRGIGRALMQRALNAAPDARLVIDARPECVGFFERIGCDPGPSGFVMTSST